MSTEPYRIDIHHHITPPLYLGALAGIGVTTLAKGMDDPLPKWSLDSALSVMDDNGIAVSMTSITSPGIYFGDIAFTRDLARRINEFCAGLVSDYPQRFGSFAVLPLPDVDEALKELEYALDTLRLDGVGLLTNTGGYYLGDNRFKALYEELNRRKTVVYTHPQVPAFDAPLLGLPPMTLEFVFDTTRMAANLIFSGTMERYPDIRFILSHAGGTAPFIATRIFGTAMFNRELQEKAPEGAISYLQRFYYDVAASATPFALPSLLALADPSHVLFGTDYPFMPEPTISATIAGINNYEGLNMETRLAIEKGNALELFPRFRGERS